MKLFDEDIEDIKKELPHISNIDELLDSICYAYEDQYGPIRKDNEGIYHVYKLSIGKNWTKYKMELYYIHPGVYEQMEKFFVLKVDKPNEI